MEQHLTLAMPLIPARYRTLESQLLPRNMAASQIAQSRALEVKKWFASVDVSILQWSQVQFQVCPPAHCRPRRRRSVLTDPTDPQPRSQRRDQPRSQRRDKPPQSEMARRGARSIIRQLPHVERMLRNLSASERASSILELRTDDERVYMAWCSEHPEDVCDAATLSRTPSECSRMAKRLVWQEICMRDHSDLHQEIFGNWTWDQPPRQPSPPPIGPKNEVEPCNEEQMEPRRNARTRRERWERWRRQHGLTRG